MRKGTNPLRRSCPTATAAGETTAPELTAAGPCVSEAVATAGTVAATATKPAAGRDRTRATSAWQEGAQPGERLLAFVDDTYADTSPDRVRLVFDALSAHLETQCRIWLHARKAVRRVLKMLLAVSLPTSGVRQRQRPGVWQPLTANSPVRHPCWGRRSATCGSVALAPSQAGLLAWLLILFYAPPRCGHVLRMLPPCLTTAFGASLWVFFSLVFRACCESHTRWPFCS